MILRDRKKSGVNTRTFAYRLGDSGNSTATATFITNFVAEKVKRVNSNLSITILT